MRSDAYKKHLPTAHANLDIVLASTVRYTSSVDIINDMETTILHPQEASELRDSDYESDPDPTGHELEAFTAYQSDTEIPDDSTSSLPGRQEHYPGAEEAIRDVEGFEQEHSNLCEDPGHCSVECMVPNWRLGSFRVKYLNQNSMNTSQVASVILPWPAIALCIR